MKTHAETCLRCKYPDWVLGYCGLRFLVTTRSSWGDHGVNGSNGVSEYRPLGSPTLWTASAIQDEYNWKEVLNVQNFKGKYRPNRSWLQNTELPSYGPSICAWMERNESWGCSQQTGRGRSGLLGRTPRSGVVLGAVQRNTRTCPALHLRCCL